MIPPSRPQFERKPSRPTTVNDPLLDGVNHENEDVVDITIISGGVE